MNFSTERMIIQKSERSMLFIGLASGTAALEAHSVISKGLRKEDKEF